MAGMKAGEIIIGTAVEVVLVTIALAVLYRAWGWFFSTPKRLIVDSFHRGVLIRKDKVKAILEPGAHWIPPKSQLIACDIRPRPFQLQPQDLITADGMAVRISIAGEYQISAPESFVRNSGDALGSFFLEVRRVTYVAVGELPRESFFTPLHGLRDRMAELLAPTALKFGIEIKNIEIHEAFPTPTA